MKRRGFLAFMGGAAVAGPGVARQAVATTMADLRLPDLGLTTLVADQQPSMPYHPNRINALASLGKLTARTAARHAYEERRTSVYGLDPDLAGYRSMSLGFRMRLQQRRNYQASLEMHRGYLSAVLGGWFEGE